MLYSKQDRKALPTLAWEIMQYYFCPRCKFRMIALRKHICPTCGYKMPRVDHPSGSNIDTSDKRERRQASSPGFLSKIFKWEFDTADNDSIESTQEKPVLNS